MDAPTPFTRIDSPEYVAYLLFKHVAEVEKVDLTAGTATNMKPANRKWILDTYRECAFAVRGR